MKQAFWPSIIIYHAAAPNIFAPHPIAPCLPKEASPINVDRYSIVEIMSQVLGSQLKPFPTSDA
jgi:hypothetical protein